MRTARCKSCAAQIIWCRTTGGKAMPVDAEPSKDGNVRVDKDGVAHVLTVDQRQAELFATDLRKAHFATCPHANQHRRNA